MAQNVVVETPEIGAQVRHTPGPWTIPHFARPEVNCACGYVLCDHLMGAVATVHASGERTDDSWSNGDNPPFEEAVANACLIAAAPCLLKAATALMASIDQKDPLQWSCSTVAYSAMLSAIAKATNQEATPHV